jgi:glycosyltransferase involved in cell wall biosynthesis
VGWVGTHRNVVHSSKRTGTAASLEPIFFIEPYAHERNGHAPANLVALTAAAVAEGLEPYVVLSRPLQQETRAALTAVGGKFVECSSVSDWSFQVLRRLELILRRVAAWGARTKAEAGWLYQVRLFERALSEAAAIRAARRCRDDGVIVILTANDCLVGFSCYLARHRHVRIVHGLHHREGRLVKLVERLCATGRARTVVWCPTEAVANEVRTRYPDVRPVVRTFAVVEPGQRITDDERLAERRRLCFAPNDVVVVMIGGWQSYKDPLTALKGLSRAKTKLVVIVAGFPIDTDCALQFQTNSLRVIPIVGPLDPASLRNVYATADLSVVSRVAGIARESGLVMDAVKFGVPLLMSDNDPDLVRCLADAPWVTVFSAGNPTQLAEAVDELNFPLLRPPSTARTVLGMLTSTEMVRLFAEAPASRAEAPES